MKKFYERQVKKDILNAIELLKNMEKPTFIHKLFRIIYPL